MDEPFKDPRPESPVEPVQLGPEDTFQFNCHKGIACFNACCRNIDILLTPYDLLRLKRRLGLSSRELIDRDTVDFEMDAHGMPGLKLATKPGTRECVHLTEQGCGIYEDRPSACRYYALGLLSMRRKDSPIDEDSYFVVKEEHCLGHAEPKTQTVREYRVEQGLEEYDAMNREWRQIILKKRSGGPAVGKPSPRSLELFFLASYDIEGFRRFVASPGFRALFELDPELEARLAEDDAALMRFAWRYLRQVLFGEVTLPVRREAAQERRERYRQRVEQAERDAAAARANAQDGIYDSLKDE